MNKIDKILNDDESISDYSKDVLRNHIDFIKETYPRMLERVNNIEKELEEIRYSIDVYLREKDRYFDQFNQYKGKIKRIEQFLINNGLINLLKGVNENGE